jgi:transposase
MEACGSAHFWGRSIEALGHRVVLLPAQHVRPYVRGNKTDRTDTKGMIEAYRNADMRSVPVKSVAQQGLASLHRIRSGWIEDRTATLNRIRGILREFGLIIPLGASKVVPQAQAYLGDAGCGLPDMLRNPLADLCDQVRSLDKRIHGIELQLAAVATQTPAIRQLMGIPGIGLMIATAMVAFVGDIQRFPSARHFASYLGLTPREFSSGAKRRLGRISKRGDVYLRLLLIQGARSVLIQAHKAKQPDRLYNWALQLERKAGANKAATAVANKIARIAWAVWKHGREFESHPVAA